MEVGYGYGTLVVIGFLLAVFALTAVFEHIVRSITLSVILAIGASTLAGWYVVSSWYPYL